MPLSADKATAQSSGDRGPVRASGRRRRPHLPETRRFPQMGPLPTTYPAGDDHPDKAEKPCSGTSPPVMLARDARLSVPVAATLSGIALDPFLSVRRPSSPSPRAQPLRQSGESSPD